MKKLALTLAIVLGLSMTTFAEGGGLFQRGASDPTSVYGTREGEGGVFGPNLPVHAANGDGDAPLGSGVAVLLGLGAAYMVAKKRKED